VFGVEDAKVLLPLVEQLRTSPAWRPFLEHLRKTAERDAVQALEAGVSDHTRGYILAIVRLVDELDVEKLRARVAQSVVANAAAGHGTGPNVGPVGRGYDPNEDMGTMMGHTNEPYIRY